MEGAAWCNQKKWTEQAMYETFAKLYFAFMRVHVISLHRFGDFLFRLNFRAPRLAS